MNVRKADEFITDLERQFEWYAINANVEVADRYLEAAEIACRLLAQHPQLGTRGNFSHPRLNDWRFSYWLDPSTNTSCFTKSWTVKS
jgi:plasmid stabilization system protein ParE